MVICNKEVYARPEGQGGLSKYRFIIVVSYSQGVVSLFSQIPRGVVHPQNNFPRTQLRNEVALYICYPTE
ncbi:hypothetical protein FRX31_013059 [Thalictrum thalictroides]|uniref:Uncharacterized protein n=1 Tax=Thalictrum thalictroides TaxID=46969 RepID=A0A7J6WJ02_THATH|nr:hypothetical protein FRX31_013059 [Thalictrum thalictroides]